MRDELIKAAQHLFEQQGYRQTTMQQVADACGISKGAIYLHFRSKKDLVLAIFEHLSRHMYARIESVRQKTDRTAEQRFVDHLVIQLEEMRSQQALTEALLNEAGLELGEDTMLLARKLRADFQAALEGFTLDLYGDQVVDHLNELALVITGVINEFFTVMFLDKLSIEPVSIAQYLFDLTEHLVRTFIPNRQPFLDRDALTPANELQKQLMSQRVARALDQLALMERDVKRIDDPLVSKT